MAASEHEVFFEKLILKMEACHEIPVGLFRGPCVAQQIEEEDLGSPSGLAVLLPVTSP